MAVSSEVSWRLVLTAVISNAESARKAGMWVSRPQPLRILAPMMPTRIFSVQVDRSCFIFVAASGGWDRFAFDVRSVALCGFM